MNDLISRGDAMDLRDELADVIGARPLSSIHFALSEYRKAIRALPAASQPVAGMEVTEAMVDAAFGALPADAHGTIGSGEMERVLKAALRAQQPAAPVSGVTVKPGIIERAVWSAMIWAASNNAGFDGVPEYTDRGNSFAEDEARRAAARILSALEGK